MGPPLSGPKMILTLCSGPAQIENYFFKLAFEDKKYIRLPFEHVEHLVGSFVCEKSYDVA